MHRGYNTLLTVGVMTLALLNQVQCGWNWGWCPDMPTKASFDLNSYAGVWYEQKRDKSIRCEYGECVQAGYYKRNDGLVDVHNSQFNAFSGKIDDVKGNAECNSNGKCLVGFFLFRDGDY